MIRKIIFWVLIETRATSRHCLTFGSISIVRNLGSIAKHKTKDSFAIGKINHLSFNPSGPFVPPREYTIFQNLFYGIQKAMNFQNRVKPTTFHFVLHFI